MGWRDGRDRSLASGPKPVGDHAHGTSPASPSRMPPFGLVLMSIAATAVVTVADSSSDQPKQPVLKDGSAIAQKPSKPGPVGRMTEPVRRPIKSSGITAVDLGAAWTSPPSSHGGAGPRGGSTLLYDNGELLEDLGCQATQLSLAEDGAQDFSQFLSATADDFILIDPLLPETNVQISTIRAAFTFSGTGAQNASPSATWTEGVYVVVYGNSPLDEPDGQPDFDWLDPMPATPGTFTNAVAAQLVPSANLTEMLVERDCLDSWIVDIPVDFALAKNTRYWLSVVPRFPSPLSFPVLQSYACLSQINSGFHAHWGSTYDDPFWTEIQGNTQNGACDNPPPQFTRRDLAFMIFGGELPPENIACCNESTGVCRDIVSPETCDADEVAHPGALCEFVECEIVTGACCNAPLDMCTDAVVAANCVGLRFEPDVLCANLDPPCSTVDLGACCFDDQSCTDLSPTDCSIAAGQWNAGDCASFDCPAPNDECMINPTPITDGTFPFSTIGATTDGPPGGMCGDVANDVWFQYLTSCEGLLTISLCAGTNFDSALEVYQTTDCPTDFTDLVMCDNDGCGAASQLSFNVTPNVSYLIRVGGILGQTGTGQLVVGCVPVNEGACCLGNGQCSLTMAADCMGDFFPNEPCSPLNCSMTPNDTCENAVLISDGMTAFDNTMAITDGPMDSPGGVCTEVNQDIWFQYVATCNGLLDLSVCGAGYDAAIAVYDDCVCPPISGPIACDNDGCGPSGAAEIRNMPVSQGNCYLIRLGGADMSTGMGVLNLACTPNPGGTCCLADVSEDGQIDEMDIPIMVDRLLSPPAMMAPEFCPADVNEDMAINGLDVQLFVDRLIGGEVCNIVIPPVTGACCFTDGSCMSMTQLDCLNASGDFQGNDSMCTPNPCPQPPMPPANDDCAGAIQLSCNSQFIISNELATTDVSDPDYACAFGGPAQGDGTLWFTFIAESDDALISTCNTLPPVNDTLIAVYDSAGCPVGAELVCNQDAGGTCQRLSEICVGGLTIGLEYTIQLASTAGEPRGDITLDLMCPCPQGACCFTNGLCQELRSDECFAAGGDFQGDGVPCDPNPCSEPAPVTCCEGDFNVDGVTNMDDLPDLVANLLDPPLFGTPEFCRADLSGDDAVDGRDIDAFIPFALSPVPCATPSNDDCAGAMLLSCDARVVVENTYATTAPGDPVMSCLAGGPGQGEGTLWFSFVATDSSAFITTCDLFLPQIDTIIAVYDAPCPIAADQLPGACNEDAGGVCGRFSELCVGGLAPGNTYYIQVASSDPAELGFISVDVTCPCP